MRNLFLLGLALALLGCGRTEPVKEAAPLPAAPAESAETGGNTLLDAPVKAGATATAAPGAARVEYATEESLKEYNKALKAWIDRVSYLPQNVKELSTLRGCPKPPPPPPGRTLVFDPKTWAVHME